MSEKVTCTVKEYCRNNEIRCFFCKGDNPTYDELYYKPKDISGAPKVHPIIEMEKQKRANERKLEKQKAATEKKEKASKQTLAALAEKKAQKLAEKIAEKKFKNDFAKPTINSGRLNRDVDHTMHKGQIRLDSKHQSKNKHPKISLDELDEARYKSSKFKSDLGGLILWNNEGRPLVVFDYEDWLAWEADRGSNIQEIKDQ